MALDLLHFGSGPQAVHYFILCLAAILGTLQTVAVRYHRYDLIWIPGRSGSVLGLLIIVAAFVWFLLVDEEIFIPGLAGGELFVLFLAAFVAAVPVTRLVSWVLARVRLLSTASETSSSEKEPLV